MNSTTSSGFPFSMNSKHIKDHSINNGHEERSLSLSSRPMFVSSELNGGIGLAKFKQTPSSSTAISHSSFFSIPGGINPIEFLGSPMPQSSSNITTSQEAEKFSSHAFIWKNGSINYNTGIIDESKSFSDISFQNSSRSTVISPENVASKEQLWSYKHPNASNSTMIPFSTQANNHEVSDHINTSIIVAQSQSDIMAIEDGYNWRKYGQKNVKGSENPRSYYKCTHPNCLSRKKVEKSSEGHVTEIIYKGKHNHPKPKITRKNSSCFGSDKVYFNSQVLNSSTNTENSSASNVNNDIDMNSMRTNSQEEDFDEDELDWKKMKNDCGNEGILNNGNIRSPKVVIQTTSDMDILDDGYRWRKYGQKVVKGNPNPRSYYKCTTAHCPVRKHVERASNDLRSVITTYEGKHNHYVPPPKGNSSLFNSKNNFYKFNNFAVPTRPIALPTHLSQVPNDSFFGARQNFALENYGLSRFDNSMGAFYGNQHQQ